MLFGTALAILGIVAYVITDRQSWTALIPSFIGIILVALGRVAGISDKARMHAMHGAALVGLIGLIGSAVRAIQTDPNEKPAPFWANVITAVLCAAFVALCVKSFIDARRARASKGGES